MKDQTSDEKASLVPPMPIVTTTKKTRQMDEFLSEIKSKHEPVSFTAPLGSTTATKDITEDIFDMEKGSFDHGDPTTTNLYIGNLNPLTTGKYLIIIILLIIFNGIKL
jgi:tRNA A-37 threonylcarbamoyl transferase component Bud32